MQSSNTNNKQQTAMISSDSGVVQLDDSSGDDSDVVLVEEPLKRLQDMNAYKVAVDILSGRKFHSPPVGDQRDMLTKIVAEKGDDYFTPRSKELTDFNAIKKVVNSGWKTNSKRDKIWTAPFVAKYLSMLLILYKSVKDAKTQAASNTTRATRSNAKDDGGGKKKMTKLNRALQKVYGKYEKCHHLYQEAEVAALNVKHRTPSLKLNKGGTRPHDLVPWGTYRHDGINCPVCMNNTTQALESVADVSAENDRARQRLQMDLNWDGKFTGKSATHGCYAYNFHCHGDPTGKGCIECEEKVKNGATPSPDALAGDCPFGCSVCASDCCASFVNSNRQTIATSLMKMKEQEEKKQSQQSKSSKADKALTTFGDFLMTTFQNNMLREQQHNDGRSEEEKMQDASALTAHALVSSDLATDPDVRRGLQKVVHRTTSVQIRGEEGSGKKATAMSVHQAREMLKGAKKKPKKDNTPSNSNFVSNRNSTYVPPPQPPNAGNRASRNGLSNIPVDPYAFQAPVGSYGWGGYGGPMYPHPGNMGGAG